MKTRLKTTIENLRFQKNYVLFDDYEKLEEVKNYISELEDKIREILEENKNLEWALNKQFDWHWKRIEEENKTN